MRNGPSKGIVSQKQTTTLACLPCTAALELDPDLTVREIKHQNEFFHSAQDFKEAKIQNCAVTTIGHEGWSGPL